VNGGTLTRLLAAFCLAALFALLTALPALADREITVCLEGRPRCDYTTIQEGIDAATVGETVLVRAGTYSENLALKSGVSLKSLDGHVSATITAPRGPVISGTSVTTVQLEGFIIQGQAPISPAVGIEVLDSHLKLSNCVIENIVAEDCLPAYGIRAEGGSLIITGTVVRSLRGRNSVWGDDSCEECRCYGADAVGLHSSDTIVEVNNSRFEDVRAGRPCWYQCAITSVYFAGDATAVRVVEGSARLRGNVFTRLAVSDIGGATAYAVHTSDTSETRLEANAIEDLHTYDYWLRRSHAAEVASGSPEGNSSAPTLPSFLSPGHSAVGVRSEHDGVLHASNTSIVNWSGRENGGYAIGIESVDTSRVTLVENDLRDLHGGFEATSHGIRVLRADAVQIEANAIEGPLPQRAPHHIYD
jgi:hypothetical protein